MIGGALTVTVVTAVLEHPFASVPVSVYAVVEDGVTEGDPLKPPGFQLYVAAPPGVKVDEPPEQTTLGLAAAVIVGKGFTVTVDVAVFVQPATDVPVMVYVVVPVGVGFIVGPVWVVLHV